MSSPFRFDGKVAIITGAGQGLGRSYAKLLASLGAKVVVNDLGCSVNGIGSSTAVADAVVADIKKAGGTAVASYDPADHGEKIVKTCIDAFGTVDIIINNAGILRDAAFIKMTAEDWDLIIRFQLRSAFALTKAAWKIMKDKGYGRIVNTGSSMGIYGQFGQANYATAKMGLHGFSATLAKEGANNNIKVNTICPIAGTRMTEKIMPKDFFGLVHPDHIAQFVALLVHEKCPDTGSLFECAAGSIGKMRFQKAKGIMLTPSELTTENIFNNWSDVVNFEQGSIPETVDEMLSKVANEFKDSPSTKKAQAQKVKEVQQPKAQEEVKRSGVPLKAYDIFSFMSGYLSSGEGKDLVAKVGATFGWEITKTKGGKIEATFEIDLKNGSGHCKQGKPNSPDATFTMTDDDFEQVCQGTLNPQMAFIQGRMKIKGNMSKASKFTPELFPPSTEENKKKYLQYAKL